MPARSDLLMPVNAESVPCSAELDGTEHLAHALALHRREVAQQPV